MMIKPIPEKQIESPQLDKAITTKRKDVPDKCSALTQAASKRACFEDIRPTVRSLLEDTKGSASASTSTSSAEDKERSKKGSFVEQFVQSPKRNVTDLMSTVEGLYESFELDEDESDSTPKRFPQKGESLRLRFLWHPESLAGKAGDTFWIHYDPYDWYLVWKDQTRVVDLSTIGIVRCRLPRDIVLGGDLMEVTVLQSVSFRDFPKTFQASYDNRPIEEFESRMRHLGDNGDDAEHLANFQWCTWADEGKGQETMFVKINGAWYLVGTHTWDENTDKFEASFTYVLPENAVKLNLMRQKNFLLAPSAAKHHCF